MRRIEPLQHFADLHHVLTHLRADDQRELDATSATGDPMVVGEQIVNSQPFAHVIYADDGEPVCVGGVMPGWPGVGLLFAFATERWPEVIWSARKFTQRYMLPAALQHMHRIECRVAADNIPAVKWIEALDAKREAVMSAYGRNREPFLLYSWLAPGVPRTPLAPSPKRRNEAMNSRTVISSLFH